MQRIDGPGATVDNKFTEGNPASSVPATEVTAAWLNSIQEELANLVEASGQTLADADNTQLLKALQILRETMLTKSVAGGVSVTLTDAESRHTVILLTGVLTANINVIVPAVGRPWVIANNTTGAFTVTVKTAAGSGVVVPQATAAQLYCDGTNVLQPAFTIPDASTSVKGKLQLATAAEAQALTDALKAITPATLAAAFGGGNQLLGASGYQKLPGGLIFQWGSSIGSASVDVAVTFPIAFPSAVYLVSGQIVQNINNLHAVFTSETETTAGFAFNAVTAGGRNAYPVNWFAIGR